MCYQCDQKSWNRLSVCNTALLLIKMLYSSTGSRPLLQSMDHFDDIGPSVVMASPGMMQSGLSRELFESWCTDKRNGVIIAGYCVEGTLAKVQEVTGSNSDNSPGVSSEKEFGGNKEKCWLLCGTILKKACKLIMIRRQKYNIIFPHTCKNNLWTRFWVVIIKK